MRATSKDTSIARLWFSFKKRFRWNVRSIAIVFSIFNYGTFSRSRFGATQPTKTEERISMTDVSVRFHRSI